MEDVGRFPDSAVAERRRSRVGKGWFGPVNRRNARCPTRWGERAGRGRRAGASPPAAAILGLRSRTRPPMVSPSGRTHRQSGRRLGARPEVMLGVRPDCLRRAGMEKIPLTAKGFAKLDAELKKLKCVERPAGDRGDRRGARARRPERERRVSRRARAAELRRGPHPRARGHHRPLRGDRRRAASPARSSSAPPWSSSTRTPTRRRPTRSSASRRPTIEQGLLNLKSPLARALIGKEPGDSVEVRRRAASAPTRSARSASYDGGGGQPT